MQAVDNPYCGWNRSWICYTRPPWRSRHAIGLATSPDGVTWTKSASIP